MTKYKLTLLSLLIVFLSCNNYKKTESGAAFRKIEEGKGRKVQSGDFLQLRYVFRNADDSLIRGTGSVADSMLVEHKEGAFIMMSEVFNQLQEGDSAEVLFPADSIYKRILKTGGQTAEGNEKIKWNIRLVKIYTKEEIRVIVENRLRRNSALEEGMIKHYLLQNNIDVQPAPSGLIYIPLIEGTGRHPVAGDKVTVKYTGRFLSGEIFDSSDKGAGNVTFVLGGHSMIRGWEEGISYMKENGLARLVIPSQLAYSSKGFGPIPPDTPVVYDVELVAIESKAGI